MGCVSNQARSAPQATGLGLLIAKKIHVQPHSNQWLNVSLHQRLKNEYQGNHFNALLDACEALIMMSNSIPYGRQSISEADIKAVVKVLRSDFLTQGPVVPNFEAAVAKYCQAQHAVATTNATSALHLACLALGLGPGLRGAAPTRHATEPVHRSSNLGRDTKP
jgi:hypothetical protein